MEAVALGRVRVICGLIALPFWFVLTGVDQGPARDHRADATVFPESFTTQHYEKLLAASDYAAYLLNSLSVATASTVLTLPCRFPRATPSSGCGFRGAMRSIA